MGELFESVYVCRHVCSEVVFKNIFNLRFAQHRLEPRYIFFFKLFLISSGNSDRV